MHGSDFHQEVLESISRESKQRALVRLDPLKCGGCERDMHADSKYAASSVSLKVD